MFSNDINRIRSMFIIGAIAALLFVLPSSLSAQTSPLTVQSSTGRVGIGTTAPSVKFHLVNPTIIQSRALEYFTFQLLH